MKRLIIFLLLLALVGCGEENEKEGIAPYIAGLGYWPDQLVANRGTKEINGWFWFSDPEADFEKYRISSLVCGHIPFQQDFPVFFLGTLAGRVDFTWMIDSNCPPGNYTLSVTALDSNGNESNPLIASFRFKSSWWEW